MRAYICAVLILDLIPNTRRGYPAKASTATSHVVLYNVRTVCTWAVDAELSMEGNTCCSGVAALIPTIMRQHVPVADLR